MRLHLSITLIITFLVAASARAEEATSKNAKGASASENTAKSSEKHKKQPVVEKPVCINDDPKQIPLTNIPRVISVKSRRGKYDVVVKNTGKTDLIYSSSHPRYPSWYQQALLDGKWVRFNHPWCANGKRLQVLKAGKSVAFRFDLQSGELPLRMLAGFTEAGTKRCGYIVLATVDATPEVGEPEDPKRPVAISP